jgi:hypothetical protein
MRSTLAIVLMGFSALTTAVEAPRGHACQIKYDYCNAEPGTHHQGTCWWNCGPKGKKDGYNGVCMVYVLPSVYVFTERDTWLIERFLRLVVTARRSRKVVLHLSTAAGIRRFISRRLALLRAYARGGEVTVALGVKDACFQQSSVGRGGQG